MLISCLLVSIQITLIDKMFDKTIKVIYSRKYIRMDGAFWKCQLPNYITFLNIWSIFFPKWNSVSPGLISFYFYFSRAFSFAFSFFFSFVFFFAFSFHFLVSFATISFQSSFFNSWTFNNMIISFWQSKLNGSSSESNSFSKLSFNRN